MRGGEYQKTRLTETFRVLNAQHHGFLGELDAESAMPTGRLIDFDTVHGRTDQFAAPGRHWHGTIAVLIFQGWKSGNTAENGIGFGGAMGHLGEWPCGNRRG